MASNTPQPPPFSGFSDQYGTLSGLLDKVKSAYSQGQTAVGSAYSSTHADASSSIATVVNALTPDQFGYFNTAGFKFSNPGDVTPTDMGKNGGPVNNMLELLNQTLALFDKSAAAFFKGNTNDGETGRTNLQTALTDYDMVINSTGSFKLPASENATQ